jgi:DNA-binding FrmR family transcriptional regulator
MKIHAPEIKQTLLNRLRRIEGQVRGVQTMVSDERDCQEILQQLSSIRSAVNAASMAFFEEYATQCLVQHPAEDPIERQKILKDMMAMMGKLP